MTTNKKLAVAAIAGAAFFGLCYSKSKKKTNEYLEELAVIDLEAPEDEIVKKLRHACIDIGFFYLTNHGISESLLKTVFSEMKTFFDLPVENKNAVVVDNNNHGYTPLFGEILDLEKQTKGDTKEGYYIGREIPEDSEEAKTPLHGPNQWPRECPNWESVMMEYHSEMSALGFRMHRLVAMALGCDKHRFDKDFDRPMAVLRLLHYTAETSTPESGVYACGEHSDYGMLTLLATDDVPGLQVYREKTKKWHDVKPVRNAFIVNLGDMLQRWSNDLFISTKHRVINASGNERYSIPFFYEPNFDSKVEVLPECCSEDNPAKYTPTISGRYLLNKYEQTEAFFHEDS